MLTKQIWVISAYFEAVKRKGSPIVPCFCCAALYLAAPKVSMVLTHQLNADKTHVSISAIPNVAIPH